MQAAQEKKSVRRRTLSRYVGPSCRLCRRELIKLFLKGERCYTEKCEIEKRNYPPGQHVDTRGKFLEYGLRLREKQKVRKMYGLSEKQFKRFFVMAERKKGITGANFLIFLREGWTIWCTGWGLPHPGKKQGSLWVTIIFWSMEKG